jgi:DNA polymerase-1
MNDFVIENFGVEARMMKLLIVDGHNLYFQMFFGMPSRITGKDGRAIQGTLGFVGALLKIIRLTEPTHIVVLFDGEHENARADINVDYKANRQNFADTPDEENPFIQLPDVYSALDFLGIKSTEIEIVEADDVIAAYAVQFGSQMEMVISSLDSDFFQLISDSVSVLRYRGKTTEICDAQYVIDKFGITPQKYAEFKSLTGDASDNIKGAEKVGPKTAAQLIRQFGSLTDIIRRSEEIEKPSIKTSIQKNAERLLQNYKLINLDGSASLPFGLNELSYALSGITTTEVLRAIGLK